MDLRPKASRSRALSELVVRFRLPVVLAALLPFALWGSELARVAEFWKADARLEARLVWNLLAEGKMGADQIVPSLALAFAAWVGWTASRVLSNWREGLFVLVLSLPAWVFTYFGWLSAALALVALSLFLGGFAGILRGFRSWWMAPLSVAVLLLPLCAAVPVYYFGGSGYSRYALTGVPMLSLMTAELFVTFPSLGAIGAERPNRMATAVAWLERRLTAFTGAWISSVVLAVSAAVGLQSSWKSPALWVVLGGGILVWASLAVVLPAAISFMPGDER